MRGLAVLAVASFVASVGSAPAEETYPTGMRTITATEATSTCIGDISTPVCALETMFACLARGDAHLCELSRTRRDGEHNDQAYRIVGYAILRDRDGRTPLRAEITVDDVRPERDARDYYSFIRVRDGWAYRASAPDGEWGEEITIDPHTTEIVESHGRMLIKASPGWKD